MRMSVTVSTNHRGMMVLYEMPWNAFNITLVNDEGIEISLYVPIDQWWILRRLPRAPGYTYSPRQHADSIYDGIEADKAAASFYAANCNAFHMR